MVYLMSHQPQSQGNECALVLMTLSLRLQKHDGGALIRQHRSLCFTYSVFAVYECFEVMGSTV